MDFAWLARPKSHIAHDPSAEALFELLQDVDLRR